MILEIIGKTLFHYPFDPLGWCRFWESNVILLYFILIHCDRSWDMDRKFIEKFDFWFGVLISIFFFFDLLTMQTLKITWKILFHYLLIHCDGGVDLENRDMDRNIFFLRKEICLLTRHANVNFFFLIHWQYYSFWSIVMVTLSWELRYK